MSQAGYLRTLINANVYIMFSIHVDSSTFACPCLRESPYAHKAKATVIAGSKLCADDDEFRDFPTSPEMDMM